MNAPATVLSLGSALQKYLGPLSSELLRELEEMILQDLRQWRTLLRPRGSQEVEYYPRPQVGAFAPPEVGASSGNPVSGHSAAPSFRQTRQTPSLLMSLVTPVVSASEPAMRASITAHRARYDEKIIARHPGESGGTIQDWPSLAPIERVLHRLAKEEPWFAQSPSLLPLATLIHHFLEVAGVADKWPPNPDLDAFRFAEGPPLSVEEKQRASEYQTFVVRLLPALAAAMSHSELPAQ